MAGAAIVVDTIGDARPRNPCAVERGVELDPVVAIGQDLGRLPAVGRGVDCANAAADSIAKMKPWSR